MQKWTQVPFKRQDSPMNRIVMIKMPDGFNGLYLLIDHMTADAQSLICFLKDVIELYCSAKYDGVPYPKDMASYIEQVKRIWPMRQAVKRRPETQDILRI